MKKYNSRFLLLISALILVACQRHFYLKKNSTETIDVAVEKAAETMQQFRKTSPLLLIVCGWLFKSDSVLFG